MTIRLISDQRKVIVDAPLSHLMNYNIIFILVGH